MSCRKSVFSYAFLILALCLNACGSSEPERVGTLSGTATDSDGDPIEGAHINFGYNFSFEPLDSESAILDAATQGLRDGRLEVFDHLGVLLRTIPFSAENPEAFWDGRTDSGQPVPEGVYRYHIVFLADEERPEETQDKWILVAFRDHEQRARTWITRTDAEGKFEIPVDRAPIWEDYGLVRTAPGSPDPVDRIVISNSVTVYAFRPGVQHPHATANVLFEDLSSSITISLELAD